MKRPKHLRHESHLGNFLEVIWHPDGLEIKLNGVESEWPVEKTPGGDIFEWGPPRDPPK